MTPEAELLKGAVTEVARLLQADGAMIYLVDEASETLRFAYDAGITDRRARRLIRDLNLPIGVGMFGTTVSRRQLTVTDDYPTSASSTRRWPTRSCIRPACARWRSRRWWPGNG